MKFMRSRCSKCGEPARYILEQMLVSVAIEENEQGSFEYGQGEDDSYDSATEPVENEHGRVELTCGNGHKWLTRFKEPKGGK